jgi:hypothetical protein
MAKDRKLMTILEYDNGFVTPVRQLYGEVFIKEELPLLIPKDDDDLADIDVRVVKVSDKMTLKEYIDNGRT